MIRLNTKPKLQLPAGSELSYNALMKIDVKKVAKLANLTLSESETAEFEKQLAEVLDYINKLKEIDTTGIDPTSQVTGLENVLATDETLPSLTQEEALSGARTKHNGFFVVDRILDKN